MSDYRTEVIILKYWKSKEYDRIYSVFSREYGKMILTGIGVRKLKAKLASGLEPLTRSDIFLVKCRSLDRVKGVIILRPYLNLKKDIDSLVLNKKIIEILDKLLGVGLANEKLFLAFKEFLKIFDKISGDHKQTTLQTKILLQLSFLWKMIYYSGYLPRFNKCSFCNKKIKEQESYEFYIDYGINCGCQHKKNNFKIILTKNTIKLINFFITQNLEQVLKIKITKKDLQELKQFTKINLEKIIERKVNF